MVVARRIAGLTVAVLLLLLPPAAALAYAPDDDDFVTCMPGDEGTVDCVAGTFAPRCDVSITTSTGFEDTVVANAIGNVTFAFAVPAGASGEVTVITACEQPGAAKVLSETIGTANDGEMIADTGLDTGLFAGSASLALLLGAAVLATTRRSAPARSARGSRQA